MNTVLFVNATIGFSENLFLVNDVQGCVLSVVSVLSVIFTKGN